MRTGAAERRLRGAAGGVVDFHGLRGVYVTRLIDKRKRDALEGLE